MTNIQSKVKITETFQNLLRLKWGSGRELGSHVLDWKWALPEAAWSHKGKNENKHINELYSLHRCCSHSSRLFGNISSEKKVEVGTAIRVIKDYSKIEEWPTPTNIEKHPKEHIANITQWWSQFPICSVK